MKRIDPHLRMLLILIGVNVVFAAVTSAAYIDPATTSYVIQIIAGIVIAGGTAIGIIRSKLRRKMKKNTDEAQPAVRENKSKQGGVITSEDLLSDDEEDEN